MGIAGAVRRRLRALHDKVRGTEHERFMKRVANDNAKFDAKFGTDTAGTIAVSDHEAPDDAARGAFPYQPVHETVLITIINAIAPNPGEYEFLDVGSGKGKALLVASTFPFRRVRGIEFFPALHEVANNNIQLFAASAQTRSNELLSCCIDAREVDGFEGKTLVYLFNPFDEELMTQFVRHLENEAKAPGKSFVVAYLGPMHNGPFEDSKVFRRLFKSPRLCVYGTEDTSLPDAACETLAAKFGSWRLEVLK